MKGEPRMKRMQELLDKRQVARTAAQELLTKIETEKRSMTAEDDVAYQRMADEIDGYTREINALQHLRSVEENKEGQVKAIQTETGIGEEQHRDAMLAFIRRGLNGITPEQRDVLRAVETRALAKGTNSAGGYAVPTLFLGQIEDAMKDFSGMRQVASIIRTETGATLQMPTANDTGNVGAIVAENGLIASNVDMTFGQKQLGAYKYTSNIVLVPLELLDDVGFDLEP